jgi:hypothetical protein
MSQSDPVTVFQMQEQQFREYEESVHIQALELLYACRNGNVLEALRIMGCSHCRMLVDRIAEAVDQGPDRFVASQPKDKQLLLRDSLGADEAKIQDLAADIEASMYC